MQPIQHNLKPELVSLLQLDTLGFDDPESALLAFGAAQGELCKGTSFVPCEVFAIGFHILQCVKINTEPIINETNGIAIKSALLEYMAQGKLPERVVTFNYRSGHKMVESCSYEDCNVAVDGRSIPCFTHATLYLGNAQALSVLFARII